MGSFLVSHQGRVIACWNSIYFFWWRNHWNCVYVSWDFYIASLTFSSTAASLVQKGDTMGWGVVFPDDSLSDLEEQIVLCYLTINRDVILTRALIQPAGGLHATVVLPYGCMCLQWCLSDCYYQHLIQLLPVRDNFAGLNHINRFQHRWGKKNMHHWYTNIG